MSEKTLKEKNGSTLKKSIGVLEATLLVVGVVIGSGIFYKPSAVFGATGAPGLGLLAWVVGGALTLAGALTMSEIGAAIPKTGGLYVYLKELFGERWAFLLGWVQALVYYPALSAALAVITATQATSFIDMTETQQRLLAVFLLLFLMGMNLISTKVATRFSGVFTVAKLVPIVTIIIIGLIKGDAHTFSPMIAENNVGSGFGAALLGVLFGYEGWIAVANMSGELKNPSKDYPKALIGGILIITVAYLGVNVAVLNTMSLGDIISSSKIASDTSTVLFGAMGEKFIAAGIIISITGCLAGFLLSAARLPYAMAEDKLIFKPEFFGKVDPKTGTPTNAIIFETLLALIYIFTGTFNTLTDLVVFVTWMFLILGMVGVFVLRKKRQDLIKPGAYKVPLYPITPIVGIVGAMYVVINTLMTGATNAIFGLVVTLIGFPVYLLIKKLNS